MKAGSADAAAQAGRDGRYSLIEVRAGQAPAPLPRSAWLEIDLEALVGHVRVLEGLLPPGVRIQAVVKADAYGHGAVTVARTLVEAGIEDLGVATFDEALELRLAGLQVPILVLFPIPAELAPAARELGLSISVGDPAHLARTLEALAEAKRSSGASTDPHVSASATPPLAIQVEVETGLGRGGELPEGVVELVRAIEASPFARPAGLWSHLQASGNPDITARQHARFGEAAGLLSAAGAVPPTRHLAASGGVLTGRPGDCDMARVGLSLYGIVPDGLTLQAAAAASAAGLRPVMALRARPVRVAWLAPGTGVSYGPSFVTSRRSLIATLPVGYADGYQRSFSNRGHVLVRGFRAPQVGTVAMDAIMVDVTDVPGPEVTIDDEFTLLGEQAGQRLDATEVARWGDTISYEVLAGMSGRLPRVYHAAAGIVGVRTLASEESCQSFRHDPTGAAEWPGPPCR